MSRILMKQTATFPKTYSDINTLVIKNILKLKIIVIFIGKYRFVADSIRNLKYRIPK